MKLRFPVAAGVTSCLLAFAGLLLAAEQSIDWNRARELYQRFQRGEKLSSDEQAYLDRARQLRASGQSPRNDADRPAVPIKPAGHFTPINEMGTDRYQSESGGLYGGGHNEPPKDHADAAKRESARIRPLGRDGQPSAQGKVVLLSVGMSNTTQEFSAFKRIADGDPDKSPALVIVDGAQGGQDAVRIASEAAPFWSIIDDRLRAADVTAEQVQVVWIKEAIARPTEGFPSEARRLQTLLAKIVTIAKHRCPNLRAAYLSSRIYAGYAMTALNPEPYAYESAFAVRALILDQINGDPALNCDPARGPVKAPILLWGPYLWADGLKARRADGMIWRREDLAEDGTHPSPSGRRKVADQLLHFFKSDATATGWFARGK